ncbi:MAG: hypothetical protein M3N13_10810 [Candidatus Eremiobacteraeota bacterium]|nr:hypothetical protein [Candidatus Eremiobacteraeota bacterium]
MKDEPRWHAAVAVIIALALYMRLPPKLTFGPVWAAPLLVLVLLVPLLVLGSHRARLSMLIRSCSIGLIATLNFFNIASVVLLIRDLVAGAPGHHTITAIDLLSGGGLIWATNVIVFALWFWEFDSDGPDARVKVASAREFEGADFLWPQMSLDPARLACADRAWKPRLVDYVYLSFTNALAVSPTDTMPLSRWAKMLMLVESLISFTTVGLILARSVNILT